MDRLEHIEAYLIFYDNICIR